MFHRYPIHQRGELAGSQIIDTLIVVIELQPPPSPTLMVG